LLVVKLLPDRTAVSNVPIEFPHTKRKIKLKT
jgi:hypothetical protein